MEPGGGLAPDCVARALVAVCCGEGEGAALCFASDFNTVR